MKIVRAYPPLIDEIDKVFHVRRKGLDVIFAWGDTIFNPHAIQIPPEIIAHEEVHGERQGDDPEAWWVRYMADPAFRLAEEIPAHQAEYQYLAKDALNRQQRRVIAKQVAKKLAAPLYGRLITVQAAISAITADAPKRMSI